MKTTILSSVLGLIIFAFCMSNTNHPVVKSKLSCLVNVALRDSGTVGITASANDVDEDFGPFNIKAGASKTGSLTTIPGGTTIIFCFSVPSPHPAGRIKVTTSTGAVIGCTNVAANDATQHCITVNTTVCAETYTGTWKEVTCPL